MKIFKYYLFSIIFILFFGCSSNPINNTEKPAPLARFAPTQNENYIIVFKEDVNTSNIKDRLQISPVHEYSNVFRGLSTNLSPEMYDSVRLDPSVLLIEKDDSAFMVQQEVPVGVDRVEADLNILAKIDGNDERVDVDIGVIDSGTDNHPDLNLFKFINLTNSPDVDATGHSTHVSGILGALDNDFGVVGVAPGARIWSVKIFENSFGAPWSLIIAGMDTLAAFSDQIDVVNMSLGGQGYLESVHLAVKNLVNRGIIVVVAAGNSTTDIYGNDRVFGTSGDFIPASFPEAMTISSMTETDGQPGGFGFDSPRTNKDDGFTATFSNFSEQVVDSNPVVSPGAAIDLAMPGDNVLSTWPGGTYNRISGTSMASPHAAGLMGLLVAEFGKPIDAAGVYALRQFAIDLSLPQDGWRLDGQIFDPDVKHEGLGNANTDGDGSGNRWPVVTIISPVRDSIYRFGDNILFSATAIDPEDGDISAGLIWISDFDSTFGISGNFTKPAGEFTVGRHIIKALVFDANGTDGSRVMPMIIRDTINNFEPILDFIGNQTVVEGDLLTLTLHAVDADGPTPLLSASPLPTGAIFVDNLDSTGTFSWRPQFTQAGEYFITFYATDEDGGLFIDSEVVIISVLMGVPPTIYFLSKLSSDLTGGVDFNSIASEILEVNDSIEIITPSVDASAIYTSYAFTEPNVPNNSHWETGSITVEVGILGCGGFQNIDISVSRVNSLGDVQETTEKAGEQNCIFRGVKVFTVPPMIWSAGSASDRIRINYHVRNIIENIGGSQSMRIQTGTDNTEIITLISRNTASCCVTPGDANNDGVVNIADITFIIDRIFGNGPAPVCNDQADANGNGKINIADVTYLVAFIFNNSSAPVCGKTGI